MSTIVYRKIDDYLKSGEATTMQLSDNIIYEKANNPDTTDMFMRMGFGGKAYLHTVPDQDVHMDGFITTNVIPPEAWTQYISITTEYEMTVDNGTVMFSADCFVLDNKDRTLWIRVLVDGVLLGEEESVALWKDSGTNHQQVLISRGLQNPIASGSVVTLELYGESDGIQINGEYQSARLRLTASQSAPVSAMATAEKTLVVSSSNRVPTTEDILLALDASAQAGLVESDFTALAVNADGFYQVFYSHEYDTFFIGSLVLAQSDAGISVSSQASRELVLETTSNLGNSIDKGEIEDVIIENGYTLPTNDVTFHIIDSNPKAYRITYYKLLDGYGIEKMTIKD